MNAPSRRCALLLAAALLVSLPAFSRAGGLHTPDHPLDKFADKSFAIVLNNSTVLSLNSTTQSSSGQYFQLNVTGAPGAAGDIIALYAPATADPTTTIFVKYITGAQIKGYVGSGAGSYVFKLINYRADVRFSLITGGLGSNLQAPNFTIIAQSPIITNTAVNQPVQGHLAVTTDPTRMLISWTTKNSATPAVKWGLSQGQYSNSANGTTTTYTRAQLCSGPANGTGYYDPGSLHTAAMTGLTPSTKYYYIYGSDVDGYAPEAFFTTAPAPGDLSLVKVVISADMGQAHVDGSNEPGPQELPSLAVTAAIQSEIANGFTMNIHNGDLAYADGWLTDWDNYYEQISVFTRYLPFMTVPGNHERDAPLTGDAFINPGASDSRGECGVIYSKRQNMPQLPGQQKSVMQSLPLGIRSYYSFDYGPIHFLEWDSETPYAPGTLQREFIAADLKAVNRTKTPWVVLGVHRMFYADSSDYRSNDDSDHTVSARMRDSLEDIFYTYKVDAMFYGHEHMYQRTCPTYKYQCQPSALEQSTGTLNVLNTNTSSVYYNPTAPIYYTAGHAGRTAPTVDFLEDVPSPIFANLNIKYGYIRLRANATTLITEGVEASTGIVYDTVTIVKNSPVQASTTPAPTTQAPSTTTAPVTVPPPPTVVPPVTLPPPVTVVPPVTNNQHDAAVRDAITGTLKVPADIIGGIASSLQG